MPQHVLAAEPNVYRYEGWLILNPTGQIWSRSCFDLPTEAAEYLTKFWHRMPSQPQTLTELLDEGWRIVRGKATLQMINMQQVATHAIAEIWTPSGP